MNISSLKLGYCLVAMMPLAFSSRNAIKTSFPFDGLVFLFLPRRRAHKSSYESNNGPKQVLIVEMIFMRLPWKF